MTINKISYDKDNVIRMATKSYIDSLSDIANISNDVLRNGIANEINGAIRKHNIISPDSNLEDIEYIPNSSIADMIFAKYNVEFINDYTKNYYGICVSVTENGKSKLLADVSYFYRIIYDFKYEASKEDLDMILRRLSILARYKNETCL